MVSKPDYYLNLNLCDSQTQSLASCELLVWNFFKCFLTLKGFRSSFDIVQFSRSCAPHPLGWAAHLLYLVKCCLSSAFLRFFSSRFSAPCPLKGCPIILPLHHPNVNTFFHLFSIFSPGFLTAPHDRFAYLYIKEAAPADRCCFLAVCTQLSPL